MCDRVTCNVPAAHSCPLCEKEYCSGHAAGTIASDCTISNTYITTQPKIEVIAAVLICTSCLDGLQKLQKHGFEFARVSSLLPETITALRSALATVALLK